MGYDLCTIQKVPEGEFEKMHKEKGYFRYSSGVTDILQLVGVDLGAACPRLVGFDEDNEDSSRHPDPHPISMAHAMGCNNGMQITPKECRLIASKLTPETFDKYVLGKPIFFWPGQPPVAYYDQESKEFFLSYAEYCKKAANFGGFYIF